MLGVPREAGQAVLMVLQPGITNQLEPPNPSNALETKLTIPLS